MPSLLLIARRYLCPILHDRLRLPQVVHDGDSEGNDARPDNVSERTSRYLIHKNIISLSGLEDFSVWIRVEGVGPFTEWFAGTLEANEDLQHFTIDPVYAREVLISCLTYRGGFCTLQYFRAF